MPALLDAHERYLISEDRILQTKALKVLMGRRRQENRLPHLKINRITRTIPLCVFSPTFRLLNEGDVVLTTTDSIGIYFRFKEIAGFDAPGFEHSPLLP